MDDSDHLPHLDYTLPPQTTSNNGNFSQTCRPKSQQPQQAGSNKKKFSQSLNLASYKQKNGKFYDLNGFGLSNIRLRPLKMAESNLEKSIKNFCETCKVDVDMELMRARSAFTRSFTNFVQYSTIVFNSQHPTDDSHILLPGSAVMVTARRLIIDWAKFVKKLNEITVQNTRKQNPDKSQSVVVEGVESVGEVVPIIFPQLLKSIDNLNENLDVILEYFYVGSTGSRIPDKQIKFIDDNLQDIRKIVLDQIYSQKSNSQNQKKKLVSSFNSDAKSSTIGTTGFTVNSFAEKCFDVVNRIQSLFLSEMPCQRSRAGNIILDRINLTVALNSFADLVKALYNYDTVGAAAREAVVQMNNELSNTFKQLGLPFELKMTQQSPDQSNEIDNNSDDKHKNGALDISLGVNSKVSEADACLYITEFKSQIAAQPESENTGKQSEKKVTSPGKPLNRSPRKIQKK